MRIAIVQPTFNSTTIGWVQGLEELGHTVINILPGLSTGDPVGGIEGIPGISEENVSVLPDLPRTVRLAERFGALTGLAKTRRRFAVPDPMRARRLMQELELDVILLKDQGYLRGALLSVVALASGVRRAQWFERFPNQRSKVSGVLSALAILPRHVFTTNHPVAGGLHAGDVAAPSVTVIPYGAPRWSAPTTAGPEEGPIRILTVASFKNERKRPWWTLEAAQRAGLLGAADDVRFTFVGAGSESSAGYRRVVELAERLGVGGRVDLRVRVPYTEMHHMFDGHHVMVLPCAAEPFGMSVVEALAVGIPVILGSDAGSVGCVLPGTNGAVFAADDLDALAATLAEVVSDRGRLARMGAEAARMSEERLGTLTVARQLEAFLIGAG